MYSQACIKYEVYHNSLQSLSSDCGARLGGMSLGESKAELQLSLLQPRWYFLLLFVHLFKTSTPLC